MEMNLVAMALQDRRVMRRGAQNVEKMVDLVAVAWAVAHQNWEGATMEVAERLRDKTHGVGRFGRRKKD